jgi:ketosteroid isomerase-like protein
MIDDYANAICAKNADGVLKHLAADIVSFDLAPPLKIAGTDRKGLEPWFATWQGNIEHELADVAITAAETLAFARSLNRIAGTKTDGEKTSVWVRSTVCFEKRAGTWKVVHIHASVPFYMDGSVKAAVDLEPEEAV